MTQAYRWTALLTLCVVSACGGGGSSGSSASAGSHALAASGSNVVTVTVGPGPGDPQHAAFNIPLTSVTVCVPNTTSCATINDVLVDTGSSGLRLMASALNQLALPTMPDPNAHGNFIHECLPFADGYAWGAVATADLSIGGESAAGIPIQVIDDNTMPSPATPSSCSSYGTSLNSVNAFGANGVLGVGIFNQDCGVECADSAQRVYYSCTSGGSCTPTTQAQADQVANPVTGFSIDNNGVILQLPSIALTGATTATGYLVFGIGTERNNGLGDATVLTVNTSGNFTTIYGSQTLNESFIDSGSNGLYFPNSTSAPIATCTGAPDFYCPSETLNTAATNQGENGNSVSTTFQIADLSAISTSDFAIDDVAGTAANATGLSDSYFDWGLPFFYGRTVFTAIEGRTAANVAGPYYAY